MKGKLIFISRWALWLHQESSLILLYTDKNPVTSAESKVQPNVDNLEY